MFCNGLICLEKRQNETIFFQSYFISSFWIRSILSVSEQCKTLGSESTVKFSLQFSRGNFNLKKASWPKVSPVGAGHSY